jgi:hypothetical protein
MVWKRASRNKWRTLLLGLGAVIALFWGAVDIVGVPPQNLAWLLLQALVAIGAVIVFASMAGWLLHRLRRSRQRGR